MKKVSAILAAAALLATLVVGAGGASAAVFTPGPQDLPSLPGNGFPKWYTDPVNGTPPPTGGLSLTPCLSQTVSPDPLAAGGFMCVLLPDVGFVPTNPIVFPNNFPPEFFFYIADARILDLGGVNGNRADYRAALEGTFGNGVVAAGDQITFTRVRYVVDAAVDGTYRITHPFGQQTFPGVVAGPAAIRVQEDIGTGAPGGPFNPITTPVGGASLAGGGLQQFLVRAVGGVPAPITVGNQLFIGDPNVDQLVVGATQPDPANPNLPFNTFMVEVDTGAGFVLVGRTDNFAVAGQVIALTLTPPAQGTAFGVWKLNSASTPRTFVLQNLSPNLINPVITAIVPNSNPAVPSPDFSIVPSAVVPCGAALAPGSTCNFDVVFNTATDGVKNATIAVSAGEAVPPVQTSVSGTGDGILPTLALDPGQAAQFTKTAAATISGTASDNIGVPSVQVTVNGTIQGSTAVTNGTWSFNVSGLTLDAANDISVTATDSALPAPGNQTTVNATVTSDTIVPSVAIDAVPATTNVDNQAITGTAADLNGVSSVSVNVNNVLQGTANIAGGTWTFNVTNLPPNVLASITAIAADPAGNQATSAAAAITFTVPVDGDMDENGAVDIVDALFALRSAVNLVTPTAVQKAHGDCAPLGVDNLPAPNGTLDIADALLILRKVVGLVVF